MAISTNAISSEAQTTNYSPIQCVTENGFSIIRLGEARFQGVDPASECRFLVSNPRGWECEITVEFAESLRELIQSRRRDALSLNSIFWLNCAERNLATYLWEKDAYPPQGQLTITELSHDDLLLATHWRD